MVRSLPFWPGGVLMSAQVPALGSMNVPARRFIRQVARQRYTILTAVSRCECAGIPTLGRMCR